MKTIVDCSNFPSTMWHRPFIVLSYIYVILLFKTSLVEKIESFVFTSSFSYNLSFKIALNFQAIIELFRLFIFNMQLSKKGTSHHINNLISFFPLNLSFHKCINLTPNISLESQDN